MTISFIVVQTQVTCEFSDSLSVPASLTPPRYYSLDAIILICLALMFILMCTPSISFQSFATLDEKSSARPQSHLPQWEACGYH